MPFQLYVQIPPHVQSPLGATQKSHASPADPTYKAQKNTARKNATLQPMTYLELEY